MESFHDPQKYAFLHCSAHLQIWLTNAYDKHKYGVYVVCVMPFRTNSKQKWTTDDDDDNDDNSISPQDLNFTGGSRCGWKTNTVINPNTNPNPNIINCS